VEGGSRPRESKGGKRERERIDESSVDTTGLDISQAVTYVN